MFKLLHGKFVVRNGLQPDGDTIRFKPNNVHFVEELRLGSHGSTIMNEGVNIRLEAVDALEKSQELTGATAARDELLRRLGFTDVRFSGNPPFIINSGDQEISGHVLSNGFDSFGTRLVGFIYEGDGSVHGSDGSVISLDRSLVDESVNTALLSEGYVFPAFYDTLPENLREHLAIKSTAARMAKKGVWLRSKGFPGDPLILETPTLANLRKAVLWPKLYRRLEKYLESGGPEHFDGFNRWLQEDSQSRDDGILLIQSNPPESVRLHNVAEVSGSSVELKFWPEEFIIQGHPTEKVARAAAGNERSGAEVMSLLLEKRGGEINITEEVVKAAAGNERSGEKEMNLLLEKRGNEIQITEAVVKAAAGNERSGEKVMNLLLEKRRDEIQITEAVVKAAAENERSGGKVMNILLEKRGDQVEVTENLVSLVAENFAEQTMGLLLEKQGDKIEITEAVVKAAARNWWSEERVVGLLLEKRRDEIQITEAVVKAAAENQWYEEKVMNLLLEKRGDQVEVTENLVSLVAKKFTEQTMGLLLEKQGDKIEITEAVVKAAAGNERSGGKVMNLLLEKRRDEIQVTEAVVKAAAENERSGGKVMNILLEKRGDQVEVTENLVSLVAKKFTEQTMGLLLEKQGDKIEITEAVAKAAAGNERSGEKVMNLLLEKRGNEIQITEAVVKAAAGNERSGEKVMNLLLEKRRDEIQVTEAVVKAATINGLEAVVKMLLAKDGVDPDAEDTDGRTPLSYAAEKGHVAMVQLLLEHGANTNSMDQNGRSPFLWAWQNRHEAVMRLLLESVSAPGHDIDLAIPPPDISALPAFTGEHTPDLTTQGIADELAADDRNYSALLGDFIECIYRGIFDLSLAKAKHPAVSEIGDELGRLKVEVDAIFTTEDRLPKLATRISAIVKLIDSISNTLRVVPSVGDEILSTKAVNHARRGLQKLTTGIGIVRRAWDVCFFPDWNGFRGILDCPPASFLTVTASSQNVFVNTMACYVSWRWGERGRDTLSWLAGLLLNSALPKPRTSEFAASLGGKEIGLLTVEAARPLRIRAGVGDAQPACVELQGQMTAKFAAGLSNGDIAIRTRWIGGRLEDYYVQVADIASQLAWIVATLKEPPDTKMSFTRTRIVGFQDKESSLELEDFCPCFRIVHEVAPSQLLGDGEDTCWHQLFTGLNVAVGFPVPERPDRMRGVELPLSLMTTLANVDYAVAYKAGFVIKGWRNALFPVRTDSDSCLSEAASTLQWHLFSSGKERLYMAEAQEIKPDLLPIKAELSQEEFTTVIEQVKRHFLGLYENATVRIGTDGSRSDEIESVSIDNKLKVTSLRRLFCWTRVINFSAGGGPPGASFAISTGVRIRTKKERQLRLNVECTVDKLIQRTLINSTILYDTQTKVAWMLPQICVVLYLTQAWAKKYGPAHENIHYPTFETYDKNLGDLIRDLDSFWEDDAAQEARLGLKDTFIYFARALDRLQDDEDLMPQSKLLAGVDFAKLANQPEFYSILEAEVNRATCGDWLNMLRSDWDDTKTCDEPYRVVTLFCNNLRQPPFLPRLPPDVICDTWSRPPGDCDYLVVHQHCLQKLTDIYGSDPVRVSSKHYCVRGEQLPFQRCNNQQICNPLQKIVKNRGRYRNMTGWIRKDPPYAVFIFGDALGKNFQRHCTHAS